MTRLSVVAISPLAIDAVVFDLDGVLTDTARIHAAAWKETFDGFLHRWAAREGASFRPFDAETDYLAHVDGKRRRDGVRAFLAARGIVLPEGSPEDAAGAETVEGLARAKDALVQQRLRHDSVPGPGAQELLGALRQAGVRIAVASSSANCATVLAATGLVDFIDVRVDGLDARRLKLPGKPDPAMFAEALRRLGATAERAVVFEDALAGVEAGRRAGFAQVVGVGRGAQAEALRRHGADAVVADLSEVSVT